MRHVLAKDMTWSQVRHYMHHNIKPEKQFNVAHAAKVGHYLIWHKLTLDPDEYNYHFDLS